MVASSDPWAAWLLERRHGGDEARRRTMLEEVAKLRDRVLDNARIEEGDVVLDLGCGDGLIGFGALARVGASGRVIFSDISEQLLDRCREIADGDERCSFLRASADDLPLDDASVDVVTTRSVLIYLPDKRRAFDEAHRVLRPGGWLSIFEPINSYAFPEPDDRYAYYDVTAVRELAAKVKAYYWRVTRDSTLTDFDERDLVAWAEGAGFAEVHLELRIDVAPTKPVVNWEARENSSGNPLAPTLREAMEAALEPHEVERFRAHLRAEAEAGRGFERSAVAYLWARKAGAITA